jgi:hypothetical protein
MRPEYFPRFARLALGIEVDVAQFRLLRYHEDLPARLHGPHGSLSIIF